MKAKHRLYVLGPCTEPVVKYRDSSGNELDLAALGIELVFVDLVDLELDRDRETRGR